MKDITTNKRMCPRSNPPAPASTRSSTSALAVKAEGRCYGQGHIGAFGYAMPRNGGKSA